MLIYLSVEHLEQLNIWLKSHVAWIYILQVGTWKVWLMEESVKTPLHLYRLHSCEHPSFGVGTTMVFFSMLVCQSNLFVCILFTNTSYVVHLQHTHLAPLSITMFGFTNQAYFLFVMCLWYWYSRRNQDRVFTHLC